MELPVIDMPECRWRGRANPIGKFACSSPKLVAPFGVTPDVCNKCYCVDHEPAEKAETKIRELAPLAARKRTPCQHLGSPTGDTVECPTCKGTVKLKLLECSIHGKCTIERTVLGTACCQSCKEYLPKDSVIVPTTKKIVPGKRHLLYHVMPIANNGIWQRNIDQLKMRLPLFDGTKTVAVATASTLDIHPLDSPDAVAESLKGTGCKIIEVPNRTVMREVASWPYLWEQLVEFSGTDDVVFYAHAKGVTRPINATVHAWARIMYSSLLDYWPVVRDLLSVHPIVGSFKKIGKGFTKSKSMWHYSGSFYWTRISEGFPRLGNIDRLWFGVESWPGVNWLVQQAGTVFGTGSIRELNLYKPETMESAISQFAKWKLTNSSKRTTYETK